MQFNPFTSLHSKIIWASLIAVFLLPAVVLMATASAIKGKSLPYTEAILPSGYYACGKDITVYTIAANEPMETQPFLEFHELSSTKPHSVELDQKFPCGKADVKYESATKMVGYYRDVYPYESEGTISVKFYGAAVPMKGSNHGVALRLCAMYAQVDKKKPSYYERCQLHGETL